ncbi:hypothetical protein [Butyrivibrio sp. AE2032]|uniref:hypothetical protein n=1 Tax=Butyrivibrio sp. AE2032 TaxID=1458463 RepID=UPI00163B3DFA|nr:hypothetical protein [Butyrivibrio sp. AE2032]
MSMDVLNFSGIYEQESFYKDLEGARLVDLTAVAGTNCMCDDVAKEQLLKAISLPENGDNGGDVRALGIHFIDNGNYHYVSALYLSRVKEPFSLVVLDHHPDMQRPMFDILSCGGWICHVLDTNEFIRDIHVIGADEKLISELLPEDRERVKFYRVEDVFGGANQSVSLPETQFPVYLSIDKDVIYRDELVTNWDQGEATRQQVLNFVKVLTERESSKGFSGVSSGTGLLGIDICGECAPDQEDCDLGSAIHGNDEFNGELLKLLT